MLDIKNENKLLINVDKLSFFADSIEKNDESCRIKILDKINEKINKGEFVAILGKNGAGKSTFVKHLNALLLPTEGNIFIDGINTKNTIIISVDAEQKLLIASLKKMSHLDLKICK